MYVCVCVRQCASVIKGVCVCVSVFGDLVCECACVCVSACLAIWCLYGRVFASAISGTVRYEIVTFSIQNYTGSTDKSQNIVEQANSNPNNTSLTISRRHIICNSSILTE